MIKKTALSVIILMVFGFVVVLQTNTASAVDEPATSPITDFAQNISGKVSYFMIFRFKSNKNEPADNVTVQAKNRETGEVFSDQTDGAGSYDISLPKGKYVVSVEDDDADFWSPPFRIVNVSKKDRDKRNFKGFIF